ncbi:MAG: ABC transporter substrate binding protein [Thermodesulfobacteriota bacterium]
MQNASRTTTATRPLRMAPIRARLAVLLLFLLAPAPAFAGDCSIGIVMWHETPHDRAAVDGFIQGITLTDLRCDTEIRVAASSEAETRRILAAFRQQRKDLILAVSTRAAQVAAEEIKDIPLLFTAVTNPVMAGIITDWKRPGGNCTGSSNWVFAKTLLATFKETMPSLKRLGVIHDPANPVPTAEVTEAREAAPGLGITLTVKQAATLDEVEARLRELVAEGIEALWVPRDKMQYTGMDRISPLLLAAGIPALSSTKEALLGDDSAAIVTLVADYHKLGRLLLPAVVAILRENGTPGEIPVAIPERYRLLLNANAARLLDQRIPFAIAAAADEIYSGYAGQEITVSGTGDSEELLRIVAADLERTLEGGKVRVPASNGSSGGIRQLVEGAVDLARIARPLRPEEEKEGLVYRPFARTPVVFAVHPSMRWLTSLSPAQIVAIYRGELTDWKEVGGSPGRIYPITREEGDSSLTVVKETFADFPVPAPAAKICYTTPKAAEMTGSYPNTIAFLPLSAATAAGLHILALDTIAPSMENVNGGSYPLIIPLAVVHRRDIKGLANRFVAHLFSDPCRRLIVEHGAFPVP